MARHLFGGVADYAISVGPDNAATLQPNTSVTVWNQVNGGTQYADLTDVDGTTPIEDGVLTTNAVGAIPEFYGPDGVAVLYLDANSGSGPRRATVATDLGADVVSLRTDLTAHTSAVNPHGTRYQDLVGVYAPTVSGLLAQTPFYAAHRGSGDEYPEHTLPAYTSALAAGAQAIEVSVQLTADGKLVCFHDASSMTRVTGNAGTVADYTHAQLKNAVPVAVQDFLGPGWADVEIPLLADVMDALYGKCVIFLEAKTNDAIVPLQDYLTANFPSAPDSVVWKTYFSNGSTAWAKTNGFVTWGYVDADTTDAEMDAVAATIDIWGVPHNMSDTRIADVVARGKPVMCWEVHRHADVTRLTGLGVQGLMCSGYAYVTQDAPAQASTQWGLQVRAPGEIGIANYDQDYALKFGADTSVYVNRHNGEANLIGSVCPTPGDGYTITYEMVWDSVPASSLHADFIFGNEDDSPYGFNYASNQAGGYHFVSRGNGDMQLYKHLPGVTSGTKLGELLATDQPAGAAAVQPVAGAWMWFSVQVTPTQVIISRTDLATHSVLTVDDTSYRGGYIHLSNGSVNSDSLRPRWRNLAIS